MTISFIDSLKVRGFALLPGLTPEASTSEVAARLGEIALIEGVNTVQVLTPKDREISPPNIYSGAYGTDAFPLHTDLAHWSEPPRFLILRCVVGSPDVPTRLVDGTHVINAFGMSTLTRALVQPRRPIGGTKPLLRLLERARSSPWCLRWDHLFTKPATDRSAVTFTDVKAFLGGVEEQQVVLAERGDTLIVDNWRMLHGRAPVPPHARNRHIERVYLNAVILAA